MTVEAPEKNNTDQIGGFSLEDRIGDLAGDIISRDDLFIVDVSVRGRTGSRVIEVYVDGDQGINVDTLASISREIAFLLDAGDLVKGKYHLNVSTPGEGRSLLLERQYRRHIGKMLIVDFNHEDGSNHVEGENLGITDGVLRLKKARTGFEEIPFNRVSKATIKLPW